MQISAVLVLVLLFQTPVWAKTSDGSCTREQGLKIEEESARLNDAQSIYRSYKRYPQCDDGGIAEGYSESVVRVLAHNWGEIRVFNRLARSDKGFQRFILSHIDETTTVEDLRTVKSNALNRCPSQARRLCHLIGKTVNEALEEAIEKALNKRSVRP